MNYKTLFLKTLLFSRATEEPIEGYTPFPPEKQKELLTDPNQEKINQTIQNKISKQTLLEALTTKPNNWYPIIDNLIEANVLSPNPLAHQLPKIRQFIGSYFPIKEVVIFDLKAGDKVLLHFSTYINDEARSATWAYKIGVIDYFEAPYITHMNSIYNKNNPLKSKFNTCEDLFDNIPFDEDTDVDIHFTNGLINNYNENLIGKEKLWVIDTN